MTALSGKVPTHDLGYVNQRHQTGVKFFVKSNLPLISHLAPEFEPVLTADRSHTQSDALAKEFVKYVDALGRPYDPPMGGAEFTRQWSERELSIVYGVAAYLLDIDVSTVHVEAGVDQASGTRHFRSSSKFLVTHDLYDRMFIELIRVMSQTIIETGSRDAIDIEMAITVAVVAASFSRDSASECTHAQLLANLEMVRFQSTITRSRMAFDRRAGSGILPSVQMSLISDLIVALHELSHMQVMDTPPDAQLVAALASHSVETLKLFSEMAPGAKDVISFLTSEKKLMTPSIAPVTLESEVDSMALNCLENAGMYEHINARAAACVMFGVTLLEFCRKAGSLLADSPEPHEALVQAKAMATLRLSSAVSGILMGQDSPIEEVPAQDHVFMSALFCQLIEATEWIESIFTDGLRGIVFNPFSGHINRFMDNYDPSEDTRTRKDGSAQISEIKELASDELIRYWIDYSKPLRGMLENDRHWASALGYEPRLGHGDASDYVFLRDELSMIQ